MVVQTESNVPQSPEKNHPSHFMRAPLPSKTVNFQKRLEEEYMQNDNQIDLGGKFRNDYEIENEIDRISEKKRRYKTPHLNTEDVQLIMHTNKKNETGMRLQEQRLHENPELS